MSIESNWAETLSKETLEKFIVLGDGHTLFKPEAYTEIGIPEEVVKKYTVTHRSRRTPTYEATEALTVAVQEILNEYINDEEWDQKELVDYLRNTDEPLMAHQFANDVLNHLIAHDVDTIAGYHPKEAIFDNQGNIIESMDAVYGLDITAGVVGSLGLDYVPKMGRGFQYSEYCKAIQSYLDNK